MKSIHKILSLLLLASSFAYSSFGNAQASKIEEPPAPVTYLTHVPSSDELAATRDKVLAAVKEQKLAQDKQWLRLLIFNKSILEPYRSQVDGPNFFLSSEGDQDPQIELEATIRAFFTPSVSLNEEEVAQCRHRPRWMWLKSKIKDHTGWLEVSCPRFEEFYNRVGAKSASLIFSSYYVNNPASGFGHTFLRLNKGPSPKDGETYELLDYGVNFAANPSTNNPLLYTFYGLFGYFPGVFTAVPYFHKVREYNDFESRDLWSYDLSLSQESVDYLVALVWELASTHINYWYLTENCSYHMLSLLEAADPSLDLKHGLKKWVIPADTLKAVYETPGLVKQIHFRPSARAVYLSSRSQLDRTELPVFFKLVYQSDFEVLTSVSSTASRAKILEAAFDYYDYAHFEKITKKDTPERKFKDRLLIARSKLSEPPMLKRPETPAIEAPHLAHPSRRWGTGARFHRERSTDLLLNYRFALHDLTDDIEGYPEHAEISFLNMGARYNPQDRDLDLDRLVLFEVLSLAPTEMEYARISWRLKVGYDQPEALVCDGCSSLQIGGGFGQTYEVAKGQTLTLHLAPQLEVPEPLSDQKYFLSAGPLLTARSIWTPSLLSIAEIGYQYNVSQPSLSQMLARARVEKSFDKRWAVSVGWRYGRAADLEPRSDLEVQLHHFY